MSSDGKATRKLRALSRATRRVWDESQLVRGTLCPQHGLEIDHLDEVANAIDDALVAIKTLQEIATGRDKARYDSHLGGDPSGRVLVGLHGPRNSAVHDIELFDPDLRRAVGPLENQRFIVWPRWKVRQDLPASVFQTKGGKDMEWTFDAYDQHVAGRLVVDTLMDAYAFFLAVIPDLVPRLSDGHIEGFPLPPLPIAGYHRLHPEWNTHEAAADGIRRQAQERRPPGEKRRIVARLETRQGRIICGYSVEGGRGSAFTDQEDQIARDIAEGYPYVVETAAGDLPLKVESGSLLLNDGRSVDDVVPLPSGNDPPWQTWWDMCVEDAEYYRQQRQVI